MSNFQDVITLIIGNQRATGSIRILLLMLAAPLIGFNET